MILGDLIGHIKTPMPSPWQPHSILNWKRKRRHEDFKFGLSAALQLSSRRWQDADTHQRMVQSGVHCREHQGNPIIPGPF